MSIEKEVTIKEKIAKHLLLLYVLPFFLLGLFFSLPIVGVAFGYQEGCRLFTSIAELIGESK